MDNENLNIAQTVQTAQDIPQTAPEPPKKAEKPKKEKMVKVLLPLLENGDTEQYVAVNGRSFLIRRGGSAGVRGRGAAPERKAEAGGIPLPAGGHSPEYAGRQHVSNDEGACAPPFFKRRDGA